MSYLPVFLKVILKHALLRLPLSKAVQFSFTLIPGSTACLSCTRQVIFHKTCQFRKAVSILRLGFNEPYFKTGELYISTGIERIMLTRTISRA